MISLRISPLFFLLSTSAVCSQAIPLYYWRDKFINFGDYLSLKLVERITGSDVQAYYGKPKDGRKLLAIGSIVSFARQDDVVWGSGINGKLLSLKHYAFTNLDVRAVRGPLTREFLIKNFGIPCPEVYGDPALLIPYFFPEFTRKKDPRHTYTIIVHYADQHLFAKTSTGNIVYSTDPWVEVVEKILDSTFVISTSLHGIVVAEAFGIPARLLRVSKHEPLFKFDDYYRGTGRPHYKIASSIEQALSMGGEKPVRCDLEKLYQAFPHELWE